MKAWWLSLQERERRLVLGSALLTLLAVLYWGLWQPFSRNIEDAERQRQAQRETLSWMQSKAQEFRTLKMAGGAAPDLSMSLDAVANQTARQAGITLARMQPMDRQLQVEVGSLEFDRLINWLSVMERDYGVSAKLLELAADGGKGQVKVRRLLLGRNE